MVKLFVRHQVKDFDVWLGFYKSFADVQARYGVLSETVFRGLQDRNDVTVTHDFANVESIQKMVESAELREAMSKAGVVGAPTVWIAEEAN